MMTPEDYRKLYRSLAGILREGQRKVIEELQRVTERKIDRKVHIALSMPTGSGKTLTAITYILWLNSEYGTGKNPIVADIYVRTRNELTPFVRDTAKFLRAYPPVLVNKGRSCIIAQTEDDVGVLLPCRKCIFNIQDNTSINKHPEFQKIATIIRQAITENKLHDPYALVDTLIEERCRICPFHLLRRINEVNAEINNIEIPYIVMTYFYLTKPRLRPVIHANPFFKACVIDEAHNLEDHLLSLGISLTGFKIHQALKEIEIAKKILHELPQTELEEVLKKIGNFYTDIDEDDLEEEEDPHDLLAQYLEVAEYVTRKLLNTYICLTLKEIPEEKILDKEHVEPLKTIFEDVQETFNLETPEDVLASVDNATKTIFNIKLLMQKQGIGKRKKITVHLYGLHLFLTQLYTMFFDNDEDGEDQVIVWTGQGLEIRRLSCKTAFTYATRPYKVTLLMTGTLPPRKYMEAVYGIEFDIVKYLDNNIQSRITVNLHDNISSRYRERTIDRLREYGNKILEIIRKEIETAREKSAILVVFPSYEFMNDVLEQSNIIIELNNDGIEYIVEDRSTSISAILRKISTTKAKTIVLFTVAGGKITEGVELRDEEGRSLIRTIIVAGLPIPKPTEYYIMVRRKICNSAELPEHYIDYIKALIKVRQALGRGIRSQEDTCTWYLLDARYTMVDIDALKQGEIALRSEKEIILNLRQ